MNLHAIRKSYRTLIIFALAIALVLSANVALAAPQTMEAQSSALQMEPVEAPEGATCQVEYETLTDQEGNRVVSIRFQLEGVDDTEDLIVMLADVEGNEVMGLETLDEEGKVQVPLEDFQNSDAIGIGRATDEAPLFRGALP